jgi:hypothetical protein
VVDAASRSLLERGAHPGCFDGVGELVSREPKGVCRARRLRAVLAGALLFVGVVLTMPAQIAGAATQLVTNCNDSGPSSLRQAVLDVASGHSVGFAPVLWCSIIILTSGEIEIATNLSIKGAGASARAVSGDSASRIFTMARGINSFPFFGGRVSSQGGSTFAS